MTAGWLVSGLRLLLAIVRLDGRTVSASDASPVTARQSFTVWLVAAPFAVLANYIPDRPYIALQAVPLLAYGVMRLAALAAGVLLAYWLVWQLCRFEKLTGNFPRFVTAQNWLQAVLAVTGGLANFATRNTAFLREDIIRLATIEYFVLLFYLWFISWRTLRCNPFYAAGVATAFLMSLGLTGELANFLLFGSARPFYDAALNMPR